MLVFGEGYDVASDVVVILALTMLLATGCGPVDAVLLMSGRSWLSLANSSVTLALNVALNVALIPVHGIRGAAISWSVAIVVRNLLPLLQVRRYLGMWPVTRANVRLGLGALACFGSVAAAVTVTDLPLTADAGLAALGGLGYAYGVWRWRDALGLGVFRAVLGRRAAARPANVAAEA
jgi:O-antigen/teichoic acid export membrane protein